MKYLITPFVFLVLIGCTTYNYDQEMAITCRSYEATLRIVTPFKSRMSVENVKSVDDAVSVLSPACRAASKGEKPALNAVRNALRNLLTVERKVQP